MSRNLSPCLPPSVVNRVEAPFRCRDRRQAARRGACRGALACLVAALLAMPLSAVSDEQPKVSEVRCEGRNEETLARVWGRCEAGRFSGSNADTGSIAYGQCVADGPFTAIDTTTAQKLTGRCLAVPLPARGRPPGNDRRDQAPGGRQGAR
jgi:hypothetical protein